ncbi:MAG: hypothetical protein V4596_12935 [Bdellovibrionota bacterium]
MKKLLMIAIIGFSINSYADKDRGGGGGFLYPDGRVELLDLVEARTPKNQGGLTEEGLEIPESNNSLEEQLDTALLRLKSYLDRRLQKDFYLNVVSNLDKAKQIMRPIANTVELFFPDDANLKFKPKNTKEVGVALWDTDFSGKETLWIDYNYYNKMNNTHKAALLLHEALYKTFREFGDNSSKRSRRIVGYLFSTKDQPQPGIDVSDDRIKIKINYLSGIQCEGRIEIETKEKQTLNFVSRENSSFEAIVKYSEIKKDTKYYAALRMTSYRYERSKNAPIINDEYMMPCEFQIEYIHVGSNAIMLSFKHTNKKITRLRPGKYAYVKGEDGKMKKVVNDRGELDWTHSFVASYDLNYPIFSEYPVAEMNLPE